MLTTKAQEEKEELDFREMCVVHGCKCTRQRRAVYHYLRGNGLHPTVNQVWEAVRKVIPSTTRESVFRILTEMAEFGEIARMDKIYNARFDSRVSEHGHVICQRCGKVVDFDLTAPLPPVPEFPGFTGLHREYRLYGLCTECAQEGKEQFLESPVPHGA